MIREFALAPEEFNPSYPNSSADQEKIRPHEKKARPENRQGFPNYPRRSVCGDRL